MYETGHALTYLLLKESVATRKYGPYIRAVNKARIYGPYLRVVRIGLYSYLVCIKLR